MLSVVMLIVTLFIYCYAECRSADCNNLYCHAECRHNECYILYCCTVIMLSIIMLSVVALVKRTVKSNHGILKFHAR